MGIFEDWSFREEELVPSWALGHVRWALVWRGGLPPNSVVAEVRVVRVLVTDAKAAEERVELRRYQSRESARTVLGAAVLRALERVGVTEPVPPVVDTTARRSGWLRRRDGGLRWGAWRVSQAAGVR